MGIFSDVLMTVDFDHTLTDKNANIPPVNLEAIDRFIHAGGAFTVNTGRSLAMFRSKLAQVEVNAPLLLYNGGMAYDTRKEAVLFAHIIEPNPQELLPRLQARFPELLVEVQGVDAHYTFRHEPLWWTFGRENQCPDREITVRELPGPFLKVALYGEFRDGTVAQFYDITPEQEARFQEVEAWLRTSYGTRLAVFRGAPRILDIQAAGTSKGRAARELAQRLGRKILVCVGDGANDETMLSAADFPFVAADGAPELVARYPNAAPCERGTVADVIWRLPNFLRDR